MVLKDLTNLIIWYIWYNFTCIHCAQVHVIVLYMQWLTKCHPFNKHLLINKHSAIKSFSMVAGRLAPSLLAPNPKSINPQTQVD